MDGNSLVAALAGDATTAFGAFEAADVAKHTVKANPNSATTLILVAGGVAVFAILAIFVLKK